MDPVKSAFWLPGTSPFPGIMCSSLKYIVKFSLWIAKIGGIQEDHRFESHGPSHMNCMKFCRYALAFLLLASGCMKVGPNFVKPEANVNQNWLEAGQYQQISTKPDDYRTWWRSFNDPVLDSLIQKAYHQNLSLANRRGAGAAGPGPGGRGGGPTISPNPADNRRGAETSFQ